MYSEKLQAFVDKNKPAKIVFSVNEIIELAAKAGLVVFQYGDNTDELSMELLPGEIAVVSFGQESNESLRIKRAGFFGYRWVATDKNRRYAWITKFIDKTVVHWSISVDDHTLTFSPYLYGKGGSSWGDVADPKPTILREAGIETINVQLPEAVVELPLPPWDNSYAVDWGSGMISDSLVCFQSEAPAIVAPFIERLQKLLE